ncbi:hypothetical protein CK203_111081 [Vitis vinifera]|uniref:Uncharacterized protein n=1 Tax=Vitis vinifera TaxID=29760 RepID=A0A438DPX2_VITVI|nr:hypothetical protein CK203_111081 [Vitis vinifera]
MCRGHTSVCSVGYAFESSFSEAHRGWIIDSISIQAYPAIPPRFQDDLHSYHQGPGHDTDHCTALRHAIQDLIDQGPTPFSLIPDEAPFQGGRIQIVTRSGRIAQPPPPAVRPFEGATSHEERCFDSSLESDQSRDYHHSREIDSYDEAAGPLALFSDDDLPPDGLDHVRPLYITVDFGPSTQTVRAYDSTKREVMGTLSWSYPSSLHQKVKFIHDGQVITVQSTRDMLASSEPVLQISHSEDDLFLTGFTFDEIQTLEIEDFVETLWLCHLISTVAQWSLI